jgi:hypothetical protein
MSLPVLAPMLATLGQRRSWNVVAEVCEALSYAQVRMCFTTTCRSATSRSNGPTVIEFVRDLVVNQASQQVVQAIVSLARGFGH